MTKPMPTTAYRLPSTSAPTRAWASSLLMFLPSVVPLGPESVYPSGPSGAAGARDPDDSAAGPGGRLLQRGLELVGRLVPDVEAREARPHVVVGRVLDGARSEAAGVEVLLVEGGLELLPAAREAAGLQCLADRERLRVAGADERLGRADVGGLEGLAVLVEARALALARDGEVRQDVE